MNFQGGEDTVLPITTYLEASYVMTSLLPVQAS